MSSQLPFTSYDLQQPNQSHQQMPDTPVCLLAKDTKVQKSHRAAQKAQGMTEVHQRITLAFPISGLQGPKAQITRPSVNPKYRDSVLHKGLPNLLWVVFFSFKALYFFTLKCVKTSFDFWRVLARQVEHLGSWPFLRHGQSLWVRSSHIITQNP